MAEPADILVIGAGVMGASIAYHLSRQGAGRVLVLERGPRPCCGMTRRSGALVRTHYTNEPEARLALLGLEWYAGWADRVGGECGFRPTGVLWMVAPEDADRLRRNVAMLQRIGVETEVLSPEEARQRVPDLRTDGIGLVAYEPRSGYADPEATTLSLLDAARRHGTELRCGTPALRLRARAGRIEGVETPGGPIDAPIVVAATNVWSAPLMASAGVQVPITPARVQICYLSRPPDVAHGVFIDTSSGAYGRAHHDGTSLVGLDHFTPRPVADPDHFREENDPEFITAAERLYRRRFHRAETTRYARGHAALYDLSPDHAAILDRAPGVDGLWLAMGFSGTGFKKAPAVGLGLSEWILDGAPRSADLAPFRLSRFAEGKPIAGDDYHIPPPSAGSLPG